MAALFVVDDDLASASATRAILSKLGNDVVIETNPHKALALLESDREFDLTFLDVLMPDLTGEEIVRRLRATAPARLRRICFLTGMAYLVDTWLRSTGIPFIEKPASVETLRLMVAQFAALDVPRGPRINDMPKKKKHHSLPDISKIVDSDDDEEDTVVTIAKLSGNSKHDSDRPPDSDSDPPPPEESPHIILVKYVSKKHARLEKRIDRLEKLVMWAIGAGVAFGVAWEIFKTFGLHR